MRSTTSQCHLNARLNSLFWYFDESAVRKRDSRDCEKRLCNRWNAIQSEQARTRETPETNEVHTKGGPTMRGSHDRDVAVTRTDPRRSHHVESSTNSTVMVMDFHALRCRVISLPSMVFDRPQTTM